MKSALDVALSMLSRRALTCVELRQRMIKKGLPEDEIENAITRLLDWGYLNDKTIGLSYCSLRKTYSSRNKLLNGLINKGLDKDLALEVIQEGYTNNEEYQHCLKLAQRFWLEENKRWEKHYQFKKNYQGMSQEYIVDCKVGSKLTQRGYPLDLVRKIIYDLKGKD